MEFTAYIWDMLLSSLFGLLAFMGLRLRRDVDQLQTVKANKDSTEKRIDEFKKDFKEHVSENKDAHQKIVDQLTKMNGHLANMDGRMSK